MPGRACRGAAPHRISRREVRCRGAPTIGLPPGPPRCQPAVIPQTNAAAGDRRPTDDRVEPGPGARHDRTMLALTDNAVDAIKKVAPGEAGLRLFASADGTDSTLQLEIAEEPTQGDQVLEVQGAQLFLEPSAATMVEDKVLDATQQGPKVQFALAQQQP